MTLLLAIPTLAACDDGSPPAATPTPAPKPEGARSIDLGGFALEIRCQGQGSPTIIMENGGLPLVDEFRPLKDDASATWRTCSYDRAGTGRSEASQAPRSATTIAAELDQLLTAANEDGPFVFISWSAGAFYTLTYAHAYPTRVAGIIFVEPRTPAYHLAVPRLLDNATNADLLAKLPPAYGEELAAWEADAKALVDAVPLPDIPVVVLTAGAPEAKARFIAPADDYALWLRTHEELAASVPRGRHVTVNDAEHKIWERDAAAVLDAIRWVIEQK